MVLPDQVRAGASTVRRAGGAAALHLVGLAVLIAGVAGCGAAPARRTPRVAILTAVSERRSVPFEIDATGTVEPLRTAEITAQVGGQVKRVSFQEGADVREGQALFQLDLRPFEAAYAQAAAVLARDRATYTTARLDLARAETLAAQNLIAAGELDGKRAAAGALAATVRADSALAVLARLSRGYATVTAPIGGRTGRLLVHAGDVVKANDPAAPMVVIHQLHPILVRFSLPQANLADVRRRRESTMRVDVLPGDRDSSWISGRLVFLDNAVDATSGTLLMKGEFTNSDSGLWPGQFVRVRLRLFEQANATVVPSAAVTNSQKGPFVYVVKADTTVEARPVVVDRAWHDLTLIAQGLAPGETVVVDGQLRLSPGAKAVIRAPAGAGGGPAR